MRRIRADELHEKWMKEPAYRREHDALAEEFALASARLEGGRVKPSTRTLERYARATGHRLAIGFAPTKRRRAK
jgi:hypothetical protein